MRKEPSKLVESQIRSGIKAKVRPLIVIIILVVQLVLVNKVCLPANAFYDSTKTYKKYDSLTPNISSTINLNSLGYFGYGGRIVSDKQSLDANLLYERPKWGALFHKVIDLFDQLSPNNFAMAMVYKKVKVSERVIITPYIGIVIEQINSIADKDSDFGSIINTTLKLNQHLSVDHTAVLTNLALAPQYKDWVNRIRVIYNSAHYNLTWLGWHNNKILDTSSYYATGISGAYKRIALSDHISMSTRITGYKMISISNRDENPIKNGLLLSIGLLID